MGYYVMSEPFKKFDPQLFLDETNKDLRLAWKYYMEHESLTFIPDEYLPVDEIEWAAENFEHHIKRLYLKIFAAAELLGMKSFASSLTNEYDAFSDLLAQKF
jgi:hypothetical protein